MISYDIPYMWSVKNDMNELIYKTETDSQTQETNVWLPKGKGSRGGINQEVGINIYTTIYKIDNQQGPTVQHRELCSILYNNLYGKRI